MPTKTDLVDLLARVDERTRSIPAIEEHLRLLNGGVAKALNDADNAKTRSISTRRYLDKLTISVIAAGLTFVGSIVVLVLAQ